MKTLLSFMLLCFSLIAVADDHACATLTEELGIPAPTGTEETMRRFTLSGKTEDDQECLIQFLPEYCSFELDAPLKTPEMYYLKDTSTSTVRMMISTNDKLSFKAITKESTDDFGVLTKTLKIESSGKGGYQVKYDVKSGRFFKNNTKSFKCNVGVARNS